jgi:hypothetical protein
MRADTVRVSDARYGRDVRRYELAWKLVRLDARTRTIKEWTGLSGYRIRTFYRGYAAGDPDISGSPLRGVPPTQVQFFWKSGQLRCEAAVLAGLLRIFHAIPALPADVDPDTLPSVPRGERLVRAYEEFLSLVPDTEITIEHAILLLTELVRGEQMEMGRCSICQVLILVDRLSVAAKECAYCAHEARSGLPYPLTLSAAQPKAAPAAEEPDGSMPGVQGRLF